MAKPNFQFEKRQRELKKAQQQQQKQLKKLAGRAEIQPQTGEPASPPTDTTTAEELPTAGPQRP